jgi:hypothetical protein
LLAGDAEVAQLEVQRALAMHRDIGDVVGEAEGLRVLAGTRAALDQPSQAEALLYEVIGRATTVNRPLLLARAERDLARLLHGQGRDEQAGILADRARERFENVGATVEVRRLEELLAEFTA